MALYRLAQAADINRIVAQINEAKYDIRPEKWYSTMALETIKLGTEEYVHLSFATPKSLPKGYASLQMRRWGSLLPHTTPLLEGVPPKSDKTSMESFVIKGAAFGRVMEFTDRVSMDVIDEQLMHYSRELGDAMVRSQELMVREEMLSSANEFYANSRPGFGALEIGDKLTIDDLRLEALKRKRLMVKPINGAFPVLVSPETLFDLIDDDRVKQYMTINQSTYDVFNGNIPAMFGIKFVQTMLDEHYVPELSNPGMYVDGNDTYVRATDGKNYINANITPALTDAKAQPGVPQLTPSGVYVTFYKDSFVESSLIPQRIDIAFDKALLPNYVQLPVHKSIMLGADAVCRIAIEGEGNIQTIVKPLGSAGTLDPINQKQTIGIKLNSFGVGIIRDEAVTVFYSVPTQALATAGLATEARVRKQTSLTDNQLVDMSDAKNFVARPNKKFVTGNDNSKIEPII